MAYRYIDSAATGANNGTSWANAYTTIEACLAVSTSADTVFIKNTHTQTQVTALTLTFPTSSGLKLISVSDSNEPATTPAAGATAAVGAGNVALNINGFAYIYGMKFQGATNNSSSANINIATGAQGDRLIFDTCNIEARTAHASGGPIIGSALSSSGAITHKIKFIDTTFKFGATTQSISIKYGKIELSGMSLDAAGSIPTTLFLMNAGQAVDMLVESSDLSGRAFTNLLNYGVLNHGRVVFRNCKVPASISVVTGTPNTLSPDVIFENCDSADTNYRLAKHNYSGSVVQETTIVKSGGASDGTTPISWKMATSANAVFPTMQLESPIRYIWNESTGSSLTASVEIVHDSQGAGTGSRFQDDEIWLELDYLGTSGVPQGTRITDRKSNILATGADQADSTATWTTTGLAAPVTQKLSVTFTPQEKGVILWKVVMAKASKTCYIDPKITIA